MLCMLLVINLLSDSVSELFLPHFFHGEFMLLYLINI